MPSSRRPRAGDNQLAFDDLLGDAEQLVKRWRDASMALRWTAAGMMEAAKGFRRLKAHKQLPALRAALVAHKASHSTTATVETHIKAA